MISFSIYILYLKLSLSQNSYMSSINSTNYFGKSSNFPEFNIFLLKIYIGRESYKPCEDMVCSQGIQCFVYNPAHSLLTHSQLILMHSCIFPVARYLNVIITFSSGESALLVNVGLKSTGRTKSVTKTITALFNVYLLMSSASLSSLRTSLQSRNCLGRCTQTSCCSAMFSYKSII